MLERCEAQAGRRPDACLADAGYWSEENAALEDDRTELFVATTKEWKQRKAQREQGAPRGRMPKSWGDEGRMGRKLRAKRGRAAGEGRGSTTERAAGQRGGRGLTRLRARGGR